LNSKTQPNQLSFVFARPRIFITLAGIATMLLLLV
jgi:hypothetical protein